MTAENPIATRLVKYITDQALHNDQPLPEKLILLDNLDCTETELNQALLELEKYELLKRHDWGWTVTNIKIDEKDAFSLSRSALIRGHKLENTLREKAVRLPLKDQDMLTQEEQTAQRLLGLTEDEPFIVIVRVRKLSGYPNDDPHVAIHRVYLRPDMFPNDFLDQHDFENESLIHIYQQYGYKLTTRDTRLQARLANLFEKRVLNVSYRPVLHAEQEIYAENPETGENTVLEVLQASYFNWVYEIKGRTAIADG